MIKIVTGTIRLTDKFAPPPVIIFGYDLCYRNPLRSDLLMGACSCRNTHTLLSAILTRPMVYVTSLIVAITSSSSVRGCPFGHVHMLECVDNLLALLLVCVCALRSFCVGAFRPVSVATVFGFTWASCIFLVFTCRCCLLCAWTGGLRVAHLIFSKKGDLNKHSSFTSSFIHSYFFLR